MNGSKQTSTQGQESRGQGRPRGRGGYGRRRPDARPNKENQQKVEPKERERLYSERSDDHCGVCLNHLTIFAVGRCNHPVCGECSTRLRVICNQNECPTCRQDMPKVFHTKIRHKYEDIENNAYIIDRKYGICFEDEDVQGEFIWLLDHTCQICSNNTQDEFQEEGGRKKTGPGRKKFGTFKQLDKHMRVEHDLYCCDLCTEHLKLFSFQRRFYTRSELGRHRKKGDPDDTSHRGHPLCEFCEARFVDNDELFRHLRRDHFYCHFCDADGKHLYYPDYEHLKKHFLSDHYLCEEGHCVNEQFTTAFRSEIDLKAHILDRHIGGLSKAATKQNRTIDIELNFARHITSGQGGRHQGPEMNTYDQVDGGSKGHSSDKVPDLSADFPSLENTLATGGASATGSSNSMARLVASTVGLNWSSASSVTGRGFQERDFPSLSGIATTSTKPLSTPQHQPQKPPQKQPQKVVKISQEPDFPTLGSSDGNSKRGGSDNILSNFRSVESAPQYRNLPGQAAAWKGSMPQKVAKPDPPQPSTGPRMVQLKKNKEAPHPFVEDFPDLEPSKGPLAEPAGRTGPGGAASAKKKNKTKNKTNGLLIGEDLTSNQGASLKGTSNLQSAADLIFLEKKIKPVKSNPQQKEAIQEQQAEKPMVKKAVEVNLSAKGKQAAQVKEPVTWELVRPSKQAQPVQQEKPVKLVSAPKIEEFPVLGATKKKIDIVFTPKPEPSQASTWLDAKPSFAPQPQQGASGGSRGPPPPGFQSSASKKPAPPPGFSNASLKSAPYQELPNFATRNRQLLSTIMTLIGGKSVEFERFKTLSSKFGNGGLKSKEYHGECLKLMDRTTFEEFLPQLIALLPDKVKQQELFSAHLQAFPNSDLPLSTCSKCAQVVLLDDLSEHENLHGLDQDFPQLALK